MLTVRDVMTPDVVCVDPELSLRDVIGILTAHHISGAAVVNGSRVLGTISSNDILAFESTLPGVPTEREDHAPLEDDVEESDLDDVPAAYFTNLWEDAGADLTERFSNGGSPEWDSLAEHTVHEAMSSDVLAVTPETPVAEAAEFMGRSAVHRLLVVDAGTLVGIVTTMDITRAVATHRIDDGVLATETVE